MLHAADAEHFRMFVHPGDVEPERIGKFLHFFKVINLVEVLSEHQIGAGFLFKD